jgi:hypothetical protein
MKKHWCSLNNIEQNSADSLEKRIWLHELEKCSLSAPVFSKLSFVEESLKIIFRIPRKPYLWKRWQLENKMQFVACGGYSSITNRRTKFPAIFQGIFGIIRSI